MRRIIRAKKKSLKEFEEYIRNFRFPVVTLHRIVSCLSDKKSSPHKLISCLEFSMLAQKIIFKLRNTLSAWNWQIYSIWWLKVPTFYTIMSCKNVSNFSDFKKFNFSNKICGPYLRNFLFKTSPKFEGHVWWSYILRMVRSVITWLINFTDACTLSVFIHAGNYM